MKLNIKNEFKLIMPAIEENVDIAIKALMCFVKTCNVSAVKMENITCAVTEAIQNVVDYAYAGNNYEWNNFVLDVRYEDNKLTVNVSDKGVGIDDLKQARTSLYSTGNPDLHSGMGFTVMEAFADSIYVKTKPGFGTKIRLVFTY